MNISTREYYIEVVVISPQGRLDVFNAPAIREQLDTLFNEGAINFVIDLSETLFMDSAGMAVLVNLLKRARQTGGDVKLIWPEKGAVQRILTLTRFDRVFEIANTVEAAVGSFKMSMQNAEVCPAVDHSTEQPFYVVPSDAANSVSTP